MKKLITILSILLIAISACVPVNKWTGNYIHKSNKPIVSQQQVDSLKTTILYLSKVVTRQEVLLSSQKDILSNQKSQIFQKDSLSGTQVQTIQKLNLITTTQDSIIKSKDKIILNEKNSNKILFNECLQILKDNVTNFTNQFEIK